MDAIARYVWKRSLSRRYHTERLSSLVEPEWARRSQAEMIVKTTALGAEYEDKRHGYYLIEFNNTIR
jgi:hypothetical protein